MDINADNVVYSEIEDLTDNTDDEKLVWDDSHLEAFIICTEEEVQAGNRNNTTFTPNGWKNIRKGMTVRTGKNYEPKQLKSKFNHMRVDYKAFMSLLGETGAGYNAETGMVIVENERWTRLIKVNAQYGDHEFTPSPDPRGKKPRRESFASTMDRVIEKMSETCREKTDRIERAIIASSSSNMKTVHEAGQINIRTIIDLYDDGDKENECVIIMAFHNERNRVVAERFQHSIYTISKYFHTVLQKACDLGKQIIVAPDFTQVPNHIRKSKKYHPFFKGCVRAIDGTHVHANVPVDQQIQFRGKKGDTTQNLMVVCDFDIMFTYVVAGWEGSANDSKILNKIINNEDLHFPMPPEGKYYLVDSGYANQPDFLAPYRGQRYHFQEYRRAHRQPHGREKIYNHRHSSLRNIIERCFRMLKMKFPILKQMPPYKFEAQVVIVLAYCTLHNFIRKEAHIDPIFNDATVEAMIDEIFGDDEVDVQPNVSQSRSRPMDIVRDYIADTIWNAIMYKIQGDGPPYACGKGRMNLYTAGTSKNYRRSFYRCPAWELHDRAFIWLDDMHQCLQVGGHVQEELDDVIAIMQAQQNRQNYIIYGCCCCLTITIFLLFLLTLLLFIIVAVEK
ncbi:uncharacterized protein LOC132277619 [Cornus florida]|uniref:uncharacterized protein LOC132277619 n=1 Tax=Cornus florida TaxID=4283 RepID=UPI0028A1C737|nr:uncharacterized protein LOC132277619 [Cornus florida]